MAAGRIRNRALLQVASNLLDIEGVKQFPAELDLSDVKVVYVLGSGATAAPEYFSLQRENINAVLGGLTGVTINIANQTVGIGAMFSNANFDLWIKGIDFALTYTGGGAAADAAQRLSLSLSRAANYGAFNTARVLDLQSWQTIAAGVLSYSFVMGPENIYTAGVPVNTSIVNPTPQDLYIPKGDRFILTLSRAGGGVFPADTTFTLYVHAFTRALQPQV